MKKTENNESENLKAPSSEIDEDISTDDSQNKEDLTNNEESIKKEKKKKKAKKSQWFWRVIFLLGIVVLMYPLISRFYYRIDAGEQVEVFKSGKDELSEEEISQRIGLARAFNETLVGQGEYIEDPYSEEERQAGIAEYARMLEVHEMIGHVEIPKIDQDLPIYAGTSDEVLQKGVGHLEGTSLPVGGNSTHTVLTAHTGLPEARLFTDLTRMEIGDKFYIHNIEGTMAYQVNQILVVDPSNFNDLLVEPGHDYATLLTCTPVMINTHRLLVRGHRVPYVAAVEEPLIRDNKLNYRFRIMFFVAIILILILLSRILKLRRDNRKIERQLNEIKITQDEIKKKLKETPVDSETRKDE